MTPRALWITVGVSVVLLALVGVALYYAGEHRGEATAKVAALAAHQEEQHALELEATQRADSTQRLKDSLAKVTEANDRLRHLRSVESSQAVTAANLARASASLDHDTVTIQTDTGPVPYVTPRPVVQQWALERAADQHAIAALMGTVAADSESIRSRDQQIAADSAHEHDRDEVDAAIRAQLADANAQVKLLEKETKPRFTFREGVGTGLVIAGLGKLALVLIGL